MANILPTDTNNIIYEGVRDAAGTQFVAKAAGTVTTDAGGVKSAPLLVQSTDGADATIGATADAAYAGSGSATVVSALKGVYGKLVAVLSTKVVDAGGVNQLAVDATGKVGINNFPATQPVSGTVGVNNFPATQAISAASLPLPTGAAQEAGHLATIDTSTAAVNTATGAQADVAYTTGNGSVVSLLKGIFGKVAGTLTVGGTVGVNNFPATQAISATSLPLPTGAAQEAGGNLAAINTNTSHLPAALGQAVMASSLPVVVASDQSVLPTKGAFLEVAGQAPAVVNAVNTDLIPSTDVSAYKWLSLHITGTFTATLTFQASNDNVNFVSLSLSQVNQLFSSGYTTNTTSTNNMWIGPVTFRYFRVRATSFTSNTSLAGTLELYANPTALLPLAGLNTPIPTSTSGTSAFFHLVSAATTNATSVKGSGGSIYNYSFGNNGTTDAYVKIFNKATAPALGTDNPQRTVYVPKGQNVSVDLATGIFLGTGIAIAITGAMADADATAVAAAQVVVDIAYK